MNAHDLSLEAYAAARAALIEGPARAAIIEQDGDALAAARARHPTTAAAADAAAHTAAVERHRALAPQLISATLDLRAADAAANEAGRSPSGLERKQAAERLAAAVARHDTLLAEVQAAHAAAYGAAA